MPYLLFLFICLVWGGSFILMDRALLAFGPVAIGWGRMLGGAVTLALWCTLQRRWVRITPRAWGHLTLVALLANGVPYVLQPYVMRRAGEHAYFGLMITLVPIATILVSIPMLRVRPSPRQLVGVLGGLACAALIVFDGSQRGMDLATVLLALVVPLSYAVGNTYIKWRLDALPAAPMSALFLGVGAALLTPLLLAPHWLAQAGLAGPAEPQQWPLAIGALLLLGIVGTGAAILAFIHLIKTQGPLFAGMVTYVVPMVALVWGQYDAERLTKLQLAAVAGVLAMVALVQWGAARPPAAPTRRRSAQGDAPPTGRS
jgi:drug/metabolite transporter (DMT)-like permease